MSQFQASGLVRRSFSPNLDGQHLLDTLLCRSASQRRRDFRGADIHDSLPGHNSLPLNTAVGRETQKVTGAPEIAGQHQQHHGHVSAQVRACSFINSKRDLQSERRLKENRCSRESRE